MHQTLKLKLQHHICCILVERRSPCCPMSSVGGGVSAVFGCLLATTRRGSSCRGFQVQEPHAPAVMAMDAQVPPTQRAAVLLQDVQSGLKAPHAYMPRRRRAARIRRSCAPRPLRSIPHSGPHTGLVQAPPACTTQAWLYYAKPNWWTATSLAWATAAWGFCGRLAFRFSTVWLLPFSLL